MVANYSPYQALPEYALAGLEILVVHFINITLIVKGTA